MTKLQTERAFVVEGRYDAIKLAALVDAPIITTDGFGIYSNTDKQKLLKRLAAKHGLVLLLDSDGAGFRLRNYIKNLAGEQNVIHVYTPAVEGKEKRKAVGGKEGLLGVEGIAADVLRTRIAQALQEGCEAKANVSSQPLPSTEQDTAPHTEPRAITYMDLYHWGFSGTQGSAARKIKFLKALDLPPRLSKKALVEVLNSLYTYEELDKKTKEMFGL